MLYNNYEALSDELNACLEEHNYLKLRSILKNVLPQDIAIFIDDIEPESAAIVFRLLSKDVGADVFRYLRPDTQFELIRAYSDRDISELVAGLYIDDLADFLEEMPASVAKRVLDNTAPDKRSNVNRILKYPEDSAGSIMTTEYMHLKQDMTVADAIDRLRHSGTKHETIYICFVTSATRILEGIISVRKILNAKDHEIIGDIMERNIVSVTTDEDQEVVARMFDRYDFLAIPVVDHEHRLVGIVTFDDAVDVLTEEAQEDMSIMAAVQPSEKPYLQTSVTEHSKRRLMWLLLLMISGMINGYILSRYESAFVALPVLVTFIPMLTDTGGNAGSQSSSMMIQGLASGEITSKDWLTIGWKEFRISLLTGIALSFVNFFRIYFFHEKNFTVALTVSIALLFIVMLAKLIGGLLPLLAKSLKMDPAIMAAPLITTVVDAVGLLIYFGVAETIIPQLR
ncbi:MAG: magnesium transporter [Fastidiosipilaceae bacterium]|nr:magnesium transporter [Clostridiaceae bacterium]